MLLSCAFVGHALTGCVQVSWCSPRGYSLSEELVGCQNHLSLRWSSCLRSMSTQCLQTDTIQQDTRTFTSTEQMRDPNTCCLGLLNPGRTRRAHSYTTRSREVLMRTRPPGHTLLPFCPLTSKVPQRRTSRYQAPGGADAPRRRWNDSCTNHDRPRC